MNKRSYGGERWAQTAAAMLVCVLAAAVGYLGGLQPRTMVLNAVLTIFVVIFGVTQGAHGWRLVAMVVVGALLSTMLSFWLGPPRG